MGLQSPEWNDTGARVSPVGGGGNVAHVYSRAGYEPGTVETYARLIATAPDLVANHEYLDSVMPCDDQDFDPGDLVEITITAQAMWAIRAALADAKKGE